MNRKRLIVFVILALVIAFFAWRFLRPLSIFELSERFDEPIDTSVRPDFAKTMSAQECGECHTEFYNEWKTTIHSQSWTDPYFQRDYQFEGSDPVCWNCHTPLDIQQPKKILRFENYDPLQPVLADNPGYDPAIQNEGVNCYACHLQGEDGKVIGIIGNTDAPHAVKKIDNPNDVCRRCHIVGGERWDNFYSLPPCGTVAEIAATPTPAGKQVSHSGEVVLAEGELGCVYCHMPEIERPLVEGGPVRKTRRHWWHGGHNPDMVKNAITASFVRDMPSPQNKVAFTLTVTNTGAAHYLPTGTPDRHLTIEFRAFDKDGNVVAEDSHMLYRKIMWRPFIVDLSDTRLVRWQPREYSFEIDQDKKPVKVEATVRYHLLHEDRRKHIGYENKEPIAYSIFSKTIDL